VTASRRAARAGAALAADRAMLDSTLTLKLVVTPALIGSASLAGRRWGEGLSGWLVGLPFTSGPIVLFLAIDHGREFAASTAVGSLTGTAAQAAFSLAYGWTCARWGWGGALAAGSVAFAGAAVALQRLGLPLVAVLALVVAALVTTLALMPRGGGGAPAGRRSRWDLPARMAVATSIVLVLTALAPVLGARLSGLLATFPVYAGILTVFAQRSAGAGAGIEVLRGLLFGLFAFAGFFFVVALLIGPAGLGPSFAAAIVVALALQGASLWALRRPR
jgi:hypothetical protein